VTLLDSYAPGARAVTQFADLGTDRVRAFAHDLEGMTGERLDTAVLQAVMEGASDGASADDEETQSLLRRYRVFDANATALAHYRLRRARLRDTRFELVLAGDQKRPDGCTATLGWAEALGIDLDTTTVPDTDHVTLLRDPAARTTAEKIARAVMASSGPSDERC
jgi:thioesterase domain-containing protein